MAATRRKARVISRGMRQSSDADLEQSLAPKAHTIHSLFSQRMSVHDALAELVDPHTESVAVEHQSESAPEEPSPSDPREVTGRSGDDRPGPRSGVTIRFQPKVDVISLCQEVGKQLELRAPAKAPMVGPPSDEERRQLFEIELLDRRLPLRFWAKVVVWEHAQGQGECWSWRRSLDSEGYGQTKRGSQRLRAHRRAWEALVGPLPDGIYLDHLCRNRSCVRPAHLEPVTCQEIFLRVIGRGSRGGRSRWGASLRIRESPRRGRPSGVLRSGTNDADEAQGELFEHLYEGGGSRALEKDPVQFGDRRLPKRFWNSVMPPETPECCVSRHSGARPLQ